MVCHCMAVDHRTVEAAVAGGARTVEEITALCRAGGGCGGCHGTIQVFIDGAAQRDREVEVAGAASAA